jgi:hypothetical protein
VNEARVVTSLAQHLLDPLFFTSAALGHELDLDTGLCQKLS